MNKASKMLVSAFLKIGRSLLTTPSFLVFLSPLTIQKTEATVFQWNGGTNDWNANANWNPNTGNPSTPADTAKFTDAPVFSNHVTLNIDTTVGQITFDEGAPSYTINPNGFQLTINGTGVTNFSTNTQTFDVSGASFLTFNNTHPVDAITITNNGTTIFDTPASSGNATVINNGGGAISQVQSTIIGSLSGAGDVSLNANNLTLGGLNTSDTISGIIGDDNLGGSLTKVGIGVQTLSGPNTYLGSTTINGGTISISSDNNLGIGGALILDNGTLETTATLASARAITLNAGGGTFQVDTFGNTTTLSGGIGGAGGLTKTGGGQLSITTMPNYTGPTLIHGGVLSGPLPGTTALTVTSLGDAFGQYTLTGGQTIGSLSGGVNGVVDLGVNSLQTGGNNTSTTYSGRIIGLGGINKDGTGTFTLEGANTYSGGTNLNNGVLAISSDNNLGAPTGALSFGPTFLGNPTLRFLSAVTVARNITNAPNPSIGTFDTFGNNSILSGTITDFPGQPLSVIITNTAITPGSLAFTNTGNTYSGGTTVQNNATLAVASDSNLGALAGGVTLNNGTLQFTNDNFSSARQVALTGIGRMNVGAWLTNVIFSGPITGAGSFEKLGLGNLTLTGANNIPGGITNTAGTLTGNAASLNTPTINNAAALVFDQGVDATFGGVITAAGTFQKLGIANLTLTGANNIGRGITNSAGTLTGTAASLNTPTIANSAALVFDQATDAPFAGAITGTGTFTKLGEGNLTLSNVNNSFAGGIINSAGTLTGSTASLTTPTIQNNAALVFNQTSAGTLSSAIIGEGSLTKTGLGTLTVPGVQRYTGPTIVNQGTFALNGHLPNSAVSVAEGATIQGNGSMKSLNLEGTIAPGNSIGTLTIAKDYRMTSSSQYEAEVSQTGADLIKVGGKAQLNGTLDVISLSPTSSLAGQTYTILTATGGLNGTTFANTEFNNGSNLSNIYSVTYNPTSVTITLPVTVDVTPKDQNTNITTVFNTGEAVQTLISTQHQTVRDNAAYEASEGSCPAFAFNSAFDKLVKRQKSMAMNSQEIMRSSSGARNRSYVDTPEVQTRVMPLSERIKIGKTNVWMQNYDQASWINGSPGAKSQTYGGVMGADYEIFTRTFLGLFAGSSTSPIQLKGGLGHGRVKSYYGGIYATRMSEMGFYVDGQIMAGGNSYHSKRNINFGNFNLKANSKHNGGQFFSRVEVGQVIPFPAVVFLPFLNVGYGLVHEQGSTEKGAGRYNFTTKEKNAQAMRGEVGTRIYRTYLIKETLIRPELDISYVLTRGVGPQNGKGNFVGDPQTIALPGGRRTFNQVAPALSLSAMFKSGIYVIGGVRSQLGSGLKSVMGTATVGYNF